MAWAEVYMTMEKLLSATDEELMGRVAAGEERAFLALYHRHKTEIYRFAFHMSGSAAIAEEVTQEVFVTIIRKAGSYKPARAAVGAYLFGIARNVVLQHLERGRRYSSLDDSPERPASENPLTELTRGEVIDAVRRAVLGLPAVYREVVILCDLEQMSYTEAAAALCCAIGTVRSRLNRGRALLAQKLRPFRTSLGESVHELRRV